MKDNSASSAGYTTKLREEKHQLRTRLLAKRETLSAHELAAADEEIKRLLQALPAYQQARTVFCYVSVGTEVDTRKLINEMLAEGKTVCVPLCKKNGIMEAHAITSLDELESGVMDIPAPKVNAPVIAPENIEAIIVPCVGGTHEGFRIGYGGGYYDRYLVRAYNSAKLMLCREALIVEDLPLDSHDQTVDAVITEKGVYSGTFS